MVIDAPSLEMSISELAWSAGLFDGEGSVSINGSLTCSVFNSYRPALDKLCEKFGGRIYYYDRSYRPHCKPEWSWHCSGSYAVMFLILTLPHLVIKRRHAEIAIEYQSNKKSLRIKGERQRRQKLIRQMARLNKKGWHKPLKVWE